MNVDVMTFEIVGKKRTVIEFVVRNSLGVPTLSSARNMKAENTVEETELLSLALALRCCQIKGATIDKIEMDNQIVVGWIKGEKALGRMGNIVEDCLDLIRIVRCDSIKYCSRECNSVAHEKAKEAKRMGKKAKI